MGHGARIMLHVSFMVAEELMGLLIRVLDDDGSRVITAHDFAGFIADPEVQIYFEVRR